MIKIIPILIVGILVLSGIGASALSINSNNLINEVEKNENLNEGTHTVLAEFGTATDCPYCPSMETYLWQVQGDLEIVTLPCSHYTPSAGYNQAIKDRLTELGINGYPTCFWDGKYTFVVGGQSSVGPLQNAYNACAARTVADVDLELSVSWLGNAQLQVDVSVINNQESNYNGHIHVYILERTSRWLTYDGGHYKNALLDCPINKDITLESFRPPILSGPTVGNIGVSYDYTLTMEGNSWSDSFIWDGNDYGYGDITENNIKVVAAVFTKSTKFVDQTLGALPSENKQTNPKGAQVSYWLEWGDETNSGWLGPYNSNDETKIPHIYNLNGAFEIIAKAINSNNIESLWSNPIVMFIGNVAPNKPTISGPTSGKIKTSYEYTFTADDLNGDNLLFYIRWGDGKTEEWIGPYDSGAEFKLSHSWNKEGNWVVEAKVKDPAGIESQSASLAVSIPKTRQSFDLLFTHIFDRFPFLNKLIENFFS